MSQSHKTDHKSQSKRIEEQNHDVIKTRSRNELKTKGACFKSQENQTHMLISTLGLSSINNMLAQNHICSGQFAEWRNSTKHSLWQFIKRMIFKMANIQSPRKV